MRYLISLLMLLCVFCTSALAFAQEFIPAPAGPAGSPTDPKAIIFATLATVICAAIMDGWRSIRKRFKLGESKALDAALETLAYQGVLYAEEEGARYVLDSTKEKISSQEKNDIAARYLIEQAKSLKIGKVDFKEAKRRVTMALTKSGFGAAAKTFEGRK